MVVVVVAHRDTVPWRSARDAGQADKPPRPEARSRRILWWLRLNSAPPRGRLLGQQHALGAVFAIDANVVRADGTAVSARRARDRGHLGPLARAVRRHD